MPKATAYNVALGGNLPFNGTPPAETLPLAIARLGGLGLTVTAQSSLYHTPCFPAGAGPDYVNAAVTLEAQIPPEEVLERLHQVEAEFSRERLQRWGQRTLDLDLLTAGSAVFPDETTFKKWLNMPMSIQKIQSPQDLIIPHPRLSERAFVLVPLAEIAPDWRHPVTGLSVTEMCAALPADTRAEVKRL